MLRRRLLTSDPASVERFGDPFRPLEPECRVIQFNERLTPAQLGRAGGLIADRPDVELYVYGRASRDLDFLRYFVNLKRLHVALDELEDIAGFASVAGSLEALTFGATRRKFPLHFLENMPRLKRLFLVRHKAGLSSISRLVGLEDCGLSGITLPDLSLLLPLVNLRKLQLFLGGTRNLVELAQLPRLEDLWLMRITGLSDLGVLAGLAGLKKLKLDWMRNVTSLPSLAGLQSLDEVTLDTMKGLTDLSPIAAAPTLRRLVVAAMPQLTADSFRCLVGHPRLEELSVGTGRRAVNEQVRKMFPLIARP